MFLDVYSLTPPSGKNTSKLFPFDWHSINRFHLQTPTIRHPQTTGVGDECAVSRSLKKSYVQIRTVSEVLCFQCQTSQTTAAFVNRKPADLCDYNRTLRECLCKEATAMSIVITVVTKNVVVQVSDVRLTSLNDGRPLDQLQRKSMLVVGTDAVFVIGWAGFAQSSDRHFNTGDWLFRALNHIRAFELPLAGVAGNLTGEATYAFNRLREPQKRKGCRFVLGGWHRTGGNAELFTGVIFNDLIYNSQSQHGQSVWSESPTVNTQFMYSLASFAPLEFPYNVHIIGSVKKPEWIQGELRVLRKVMDNRGGAAAIARGCVDIARKAAGYTGTIGKDLIIVTLNKNGVLNSAFLSENGTQEWVVPDVITPKGGTTQGTIRAILSGDEISVKFRAKGLKR